MQVHEIVVVGSGVIGLCCASYLQEAGYKVTLIDKGAPGQATSFGNAGVVSPWSCVPQALPGIWKSIPNYLLSKDGPANISPGSALRYIPWLWRFLKESNREKAKHNSDVMHQFCGDSVHLYRSLLKNAGDESLIKDSLQVHAFRNANNADINSLAYEIRKLKGASVEMINQNELRELEPYLSKGFQAAIVMPHIARSINPGRLCKVLADSLQRNGATFITGKVLALHRADANWQLTLEGSSLTTKKVVIAAGAWSTSLLKPLGISLPMAAERGYHLWFDDTSVEIRNSVMDVDAHVVASSMETGIRIAGLAEFSSVDAPIKKANLTKLRRIAENMVPALSDVTARPWMGVRASFPDSLPVVEPVANQPNLYAAFGHSHYGLMMAPKTGQIIAQMVKGETPNINAIDFSSRRF